jgi:phage terminase small subunit|tara:strand:- start:63 stop:725 length:663 start_codon:yes stop_codon:yes gene_type:complete
MKEPLNKSSDLNFKKIPRSLVLNNNPKPSWRKEKPPKNPNEKRGKVRVHEGQKLTRKQELFVKELVSNDGQITLIEAAERAGYAKSSTHVRAYELTNPHVSPHVVAAIKRERDILDEKFGVNYSRHIKDLQRIRDIALENGAYSAAVQAEYRRGMAQGDIYVNKSEIRHGSIDSMSKDEVVKAIEEIKKSYGEQTIDITPDGEEGSGPLSTTEVGNKEVE